MYMKQKYIRKIHCHSCNKLIDKPPSLTSNKLTSATINVIPIIKKKYGVAIKIQDGVVVKINSFVRYAENLAKEKSLVREPSISIVQ